MKQYVDLLCKIFDEGEQREDRTGVGTLSIFGGQLEFDLRERFPLVTIKKTLWRSAFIEMLWFLRGEPNIKFLKDHDVSIWDAWADEDGNLGPIYGVQWRKWPGKIVYTGNDRAQPNRTGPNSRFSVLYIDQSHGGSAVHQEHIDQVRDLIDGIKKNPNGRRHIVTAWNPAYIDVMGLPPCHRDFHCYVSNDGHLDLMMSIRSWDTALGGPFNIAQYALLTHLIGRATNLKPRYLKITYGDAHIYLNHVKLVDQWFRENEIRRCMPQLVINTDNTDIDGYKIEDFAIEGYESNGFLKLPIAV